MKYYPVIEDNNPASLTNKLKDIELIDFRSAGFSAENIDLINKTDTNKIKDDDVKTKLQKGNLLIPGDIKPGESKTISNDPNFINVGGTYSFNNIKDYHKYQLLKKKDSNILNEQKYNLNIGEKTLQDYFKLLNNPETNDLKDLYGEYHPVQKRT